jgi:hypothetical protein
MSEDKTQGCVFDQIVNLSGLDREVVIQELKHYTGLRNKPLQDLTLDDMRVVVAQYLRKTFSEMLEVDP